jgi:hypothetical protein
MSILGRVRNYFTSQEQEEREDPHFERLAHPMTAYKLDDIPPAQRKELSEKGFTTQEMIDQYNREIFEIFGNLDS